MNDKQLAHEIAWARAENNCHAGLEDRIVAALTTVRQEERRAAFKVLCPDCAEGDEPTFDERARWYYHDAGTDREIGCAASKLRLETAANEPQGKSKL